MDQFYLKNVARYRSLVNALDPMRKPRIQTEESGSNMVVSARIRPLLEDEGFPCCIFPRSTQKNTVDIHDLYNHPKGTPILKSFDYQVDRLFESTSTTEEIYEDLVAGLVPFAWHGGVATLFAYGQTGSGKTHTISRLEQLVAESLMRGTPDGEREIFITIIDLAGNSVFDLLSERSPVSLREDALGVTQIVGADEYQVFGEDEMRGLIERATAFRRTESTLKNDASSRSHAICRVRIKDTVKQSDGFLYMIDLAGSESARDVAMHGADRMRETREINVSLSILKDCIRAKAQADFSPKDKRKTMHIPFRQSALTRVLKHVFDPAGTRACKTVVIACVNPSLADVGASKNTLRFAEMLRVLVPTGKSPGLDPTAPTNWTNPQLRKWIEENCGLPQISPSILAPRESGAQLLELSSLEFEYRCLKCPGVKPEQAISLRSKFWQVHLDSCQAGKSS